MKDSPFNIMTNKKYKSISISNLIINPDNDRFESVENEKQAIDIMLTKLGDKIYYIAIHILDFSRFDLTD